MDRIDINLFNAWHRISAKCRADRVLALKRASRRHRVTLAKPLRAWCLCLRASDRRITPMNAMLEPAAHVRLGLDEGTDTLIENRRAHRVTLDGATIRELMKPVRIAWRARTGRRSRPNAV